MMGPMQQIPTGFFSEWKLSRAFLRSGSTSRFLPCEAKVDRFLAAPNPPGINTAYLLNRTHIIVRRIKLSQGFNSPTSNSSRFDQCIALFRLRLSSVGIDHISLVFIWSKYIILDSLLREMNENRNRLSDFTNSYLHSTFHHRPHILRARQLLYLKRISWVSLISF